VAESLGIRVGDRPVTGSGDAAERQAEVSLDMICVVGFDGRVRAVDPAFEETLGYSRDELIARPLAGLVHPDDRQTTLEAFGDVVEGDDATQFQSRCISKDGSERWVQWRCRASPDQKVIYAIARDLTEGPHAAADQPALRHVATLIARQAPLEEVFSDVANSVAELFGTHDILLTRFDANRLGLVVASSGRFSKALRVGSRGPLSVDDATARVFTTGEPARTDSDEIVTSTIAESSGLISGLSAVAVPIMVDDRLWGALTVAATWDTTPPTGVEARLGQFTELMAIAIANADAHARAERLANEQGALRRIATLVARGASAAAVFDAVAAEMERLLGADGVTLSRYEADDDLTFLAHHGTGAEMALPGTRVNLGGDNTAAKVRRTRKPARTEDYKDRHGAIAELTRTIGIRSTVGVPIIVDGRLWGVGISQWRGDHAPPADTEERMEQFAELLGTAIANADSRDQLTASRARLVTEADEARRRVVRDLHDGAQHRLVHAIVTLKLARLAFEENDETGQRLVDEALQHAERSNAELRELAHGILPAALTRGGLRAGVDALVERLDLPVHAELPAARLRSEVEATAYFVVAEALTNIVKHSHASQAEVAGTVEDGVLRLHVRDDGNGGADPTGHGLVGMADRVAALGGQLKIESRSGAGTHLQASLPLSGTGPADTWEL
jgi:PAS domain S-box-containing protein